MDDTASFMLEKESLRILHTALDRLDVGFKSLPAAGAQADERQKPGQQVHVFR